MSIQRDKKDRSVIAAILSRCMFAACVVFCMSMQAGAAELAISEDFQVYASLTDTVVSMTGKSELHVTNASSPLTGCTINLNSIDSWLFLDQIIPSVAASSYLGQVKVNGSQAILNSNVRVVQYVNGAVIIPHSSGFQPLQVFSDKDFKGDSRYLSQYEQYNIGSLGSMASSISSFILKRGYTATFAQNENGTGISKNYVAQDCDLEIGALPDELDDKINFVRIFPWRWVSKKGIAGNIGGNLDIRWWYNWNLDQNSTLDKEYVPIRQQRWWPGLDQDWKTRGATHLLGYNEPDKSDQANMAVGDAIWSWPDLLWTGLRVGSPAVTDGGRDGWLYPFMDQADADGLRVDFVAVHYYWCYSPSNPSGAASQMYNFLKAVHDRTKRPIWITEWNNGANWTGCGDPTYAQQAEAIGAMVDMLDSTPWVERYALYNWVEDVRRLEWDDGSLTTAGEVYRDQVSSISYQQQAYASDQPAFALYNFDNDNRDFSGNANHPLAIGLPKKQPGKNNNAIDLDGSDDYLMLPTNMADATDFSFAAWVYWNGGNQWQRIFDFGADSNNYMFLTPSAYSSQLRFAITTSGYNGEQRLESGAFPVNQWTHVAVTLSGNQGRLYVNGSQVDVETIALDPSTLGAYNNYIGKSQFSSDPLFDGMLDDVIFTNFALAPADVAAVYNNHFPVFSADIIDGGSIAPGTAFSGSLSELASDADAGDVVVFNKVSGPAWLEVATDGTLSGTPAYTDSGQNTFVVSVADSLNGIDFAQLNISVDLVKAMTARYAFDSNVNDMLGLNHASASGSPSYIDGKLGKAINLDGSNDIVTLPDGVVNTEDITIAAWVYWDGGSNWQRIFDFGNSTNNYMFLTPSSSSSTLRFEINNGGISQQIETSRLTIARWMHLAVTLSGDTGSLYVNGVLRASNSSMTINPKDFNPSTNYIGDSQFSSDPLFNGKIDDFRIYNYALSLEEIESLALPPSFTSDPIVNSNAIELGSYAGNSLTGYADKGISFSKVSGPGWLNVAEDGSLSGMPVNLNVGENTFTVRVDNGSGSYATAQMQITVDNIYSGTQGIEDIAGFASQWLQTDCSDIPACNGASLDGDTSVTMSDLSVLSQNWLEDDTLQLHITFDEGSGDTVSDSSMYKASPGILVNGPTWDTGYLGSCLNFDGTDDYVHVEDYQGIGYSNARSVTAWIKTDEDLANADTNVMTIASWGKPAINSMWAVIIDGSTGQLSLSIYGPQIMGGPDLEDGQWHHVAVVLSSDGNNINQVKLYVDGVEVATNAASLDAVINTVLTEDVLIGGVDLDPAEGLQSQPLFMFDGLIDDFRIYNTDLSANTIAELATIPTDN